MAFGSFCSNYTVAGEVRGLMAQKQTHSSRSVDLQTLWVYFDDMIPGSDSKLQADLEDDVWQRCSRTKTVLQLISVLECLLANPSPSSEEDVKTLLSQYATISSELYTNREVFHKS